MLNRTLNTELKVGIFTVCGLGVLAVTAVTLEGNPFAAKAQTFYTELANVGGIGTRTQVRTSGVQVGEVTSIDIMPNGARVNFKVESKVSVPKGSTIELKSRGILGDVYLEIQRNQAATENFKSGAFIPKTAETSDLNSLMASLGSIAKDIQTVSRTLASVIGTTDGQSSLQNILSNIEHVTADARDVIASEKKDIRAMIAGFRQSAESLSSLLERNDGRVDDIMQQVASTTHDMRYFAAQLRDLTSGDNRNRLESIVAGIDDSLKNIKTASNKVQLIVDKVERGEGTLGQLVSKDDTANELRTTLKSVQEILKPASRLKVDIDYKGEYRTGKNPIDGTVKNHFAARISTRPDKYYLLGVSDSQGSRKVSTKSTTFTPGNLPPYGSQPPFNQTESRVETVADERGYLRFDAQFAKRFDFFGVRFGLFESYGGVAADTYFFNDRLQASLEASHFSSAATNAQRFDPGGLATVKVFANVFVTPNVYLTGGADNLGRQPHGSPFIGGGLRFTDDDFKAIVGAAALAR